MSSSREPSIIRSNAPHTVEVTPGSLNAKGKKNIVNSEDTKHESKKHKLDTNKLSNQNEVTKISDDKNSTELLKVKEDIANLTNENIDNQIDTTNNVIQIEQSTDHGNIQNINEDKIRDNNLKKPSNEKNYENNQLIDLKNDNFENCIEIESNKSTDNSIKINIENSISNIQKIDKSDDIGNSVKINEVLTENNLSKIPFENENSTNKQKKSNDKIEDNNVSLKLTKESNENINISVDKSNIENKQTISNVNIDQNLKFLDENNTPKNNFQKTSPDQLDPVSKLNNAKKISSSERKQLIQEQKKLIEEKKKRQEDYHGRLFSKKNQVENLNQQLDEIEKMKTIN